MSDTVRAVMVNYVMDSVSLVTLFGAMADLLPPVAALLTIVWVLIRIYETETVQWLLYRNKIEISDEDK